jgi:hypothetical protein
LNKLTTKAFYCFWTSDDCILNRRYTIAGLDHFLFKHNGPFAAVFRAEPIASLAPFFGQTTHISWWEKHASVHASNGKRHPLHSRQE